IRPSRAGSWTTRPRFAVRFTASSSSSRPVRTLLVPQSGQGIRLRDKSAGSQDATRPTSTCYVPPNSWHTRCSPHPSVIETTYVRNPIESPRRSAPDEVAVMPTSPFEPRARVRAVLRRESTSDAGVNRRDTRGAGLFDAVLRDVAYACRSLRNAPLVAVTIVTTIGLGLGLVAVVFTIFNAAIFRADDVRN